MKDIFVSNEAAGCRRTRGFKEFEATPVSCQHKVVQEIIYI